MARFMREYGVTPYDAMVLTLERESADYYEARSPMAARSATARPWPTS